jgi:branched-chain amino acid transport system ATP-binding protein
LEALDVLLSLDGLSKSFGSLKVTDDITLDVPEGQALGVLGPNGAGKTTLFNLISGDLWPDRGGVLFQGENVTRLPPHQRCRKGIGRTYQIPHPFVGMTVFENLLVAATHGAGLREYEAYPVCVDVLERTGLKKRANALAGSLTLLDRKRLELARALATQPKLLLLDEIAGGLTDHEAHALVDLINEIRASGISLIWIEHVVHALLKVADRLMVIDFGAMLAEGEPQAVMDNAEVRRVYMGIEV